MQIATPDVPQRVLAGRFAVLRAARRVWAVGAIHGDAGRLRALHEALMPRLSEGDRLVYLGNYVGLGPEIRGALAELIRFRRWVLALPPYMDGGDVVFLRGAQEEMWQKLLQLEYAPDPGVILDYVLARGVGATVKAYGGAPDEARAAIAQGPDAIARWTAALRRRMHERPGHDAFFAGLKRAAYTDTGALLFVHAGIDATKPLTHQNDAFWWAGRSFAGLAAPYNGFRRVVRGYDPQGGGYRAGEHAITIDGGCGRGGPLMALCLTPGGEVLDRLSI